MGGPGWRYKFQGCHFTQGVKSHEVEELAREMRADRRDAGTKTQSTPTFRGQRHKQEPASPTEQEWSGREKETQRE